MQCSVDKKVNSKAGRTAKLDSAAYTGTRLFGMSKWHRAKAAMLLLDLSL